jgi:hypothetical protein
MLKNHELPLLEERRKQLSLAFVFKVVEGLINVIKSGKLQTLFHPINSKTVDVLTTKDATLSFIKTLYL